MSELTKTILLEFRERFIQDHNKGEERFLRGLFIEEFEAFLTAALEKQEIFSYNKGYEDGLADNHEDCVLPK